MSCKKEDCPLVHPSERDIEREMKELQRIKQGKKKVTVKVVKEVIDEEYVEEKKAVYNKIIKEKEL